MDSIGKAYYSASMRRQLSRAHTDQDYGLIKRLRREGTILAMAIVGHRARRAGRSFITTLKAMSNAFASCSWITMGAADGKIMPEDAWDLGEQ
eukprot:4548224-Pyramimonas_sp.AAC.1